MEEAGEGGQKEAGGITTVVERGGGKEGGGKSGENTLAREGVAEKRPRTEKNDTVQEAVGGRGRTITVMIQEGAHDQHLSH